MKRSELGDLNQMNESGFFVGGEQLFSAVAIIYH